MYDVKSTRSVVGTLVSTKNLNTGRKVLIKLKLTKCRWGPVGKEDFAEKV